MWSATGDDAVVPAQAGVDRRRNRRPARRHGGPRAGGGGPSHMSGLRVSCAWSPRRRGWTDQAHMARRHLLVVPAQAGVDRSGGSPAGRRFRGPRAGGGGPASAAGAAAAKAWSPRRRGWTAAMWSATGDDAVVPAQAGVDRRRNRRPARRHGGPRAGGGGPSHMSGLRVSCAWSPRRRGWTDQAHMARRHLLVVPAQAGVDRSGGSPAGRRFRGPRAGGGGPASAAGAAAAKAWSPRRRGWTALLTPDPLGLYVVPAQAGVDRPGSRPRSCRWRGPRAGGGGPNAVMSSSPIQEWSPRRRGWTVPHPARVHGWTVVPAQAGVDRSSARASARPAGGPRAGGGGPFLPPPPGGVGGWSPRRRGWTAVRSPEGVE